MYTLIRVAAPVALAVLLAGCAAIPSAAPSEPAAAPAPAATSAPPSAPFTGEPEPDPEPVGVHVTATSVKVVRSDGTTGGSFDYFDPASAAIEGLSEIFGSDPEVTEDPGTYNRPRSTIYDWDGLVLRDPHGAAEAPFSPDWWITVTAAEVAGITVDTVDGVHVGDSAPALEAAFPDDSRRTTCCGQPERIDFRLGAEAVDATAEEVASYTGGTFDRPFEFAVWLIAVDPAATITEIRSPSPNCCGL